MTKHKNTAAYMISAVAEQYEIHPQTLRARGQPAAREQHAGAGDRYQFGYDANGT